MKTKGESKVVSFKSSFQWLNADKFFCKVMKGTQFTQNLFTVGMYGMGQQWCTQRQF